MTGLHISKAHNMTTQVQNRPAASFLATVFSAPMALVAAIARWNLTRQTRNALSRLTDRELLDIGLRREEIDLIQ
ncbi:MAG: DUF1127 domain-containing protein [Rhodobacteraceae bacterium]|nr:DUF1127 domain-containing protein [Paracoccaceae bacterium]